MILARLSRTRPISWLAALLWMSAVAAGICEPRASTDRERRQQAVAAHGDALPAARVAPGGVVARLVPQDRSFDGLLFAPPERMALRAGPEYAPARRRMTTAPAGAARPRRLTFRYDATAPPRAL
jgi:hypothetical protein